jgi:hypothetical protein
MPNLLSSAGAWPSGCSLSAVEHLLDAAVKSGDLAFPVVENVAAVRGRVAGGGDFVPNLNVENPRFAGSRRVVGGQEPIALTRVSWLTLQ